MSFLAGSFLENIDVNKSKSNTYVNPSTQSQKNGNTTSIQLSQLTPMQSLRGNSYTSSPIIYPCPDMSYQSQKSPPDLSLAMKHGTSHRVAPLEDLAASIDTCETTGVPYTKKRLSLWAGLEKMSHLGPVFPMYFLLIKQIAIIVLLLCILSGTIWVIQQVQGSRRLFPYQEYASLYYQSDFQETVLVAGSLCVMLLMIFILHRFRRDQKLTKLACKGDNLSSSDYTIMSSNLGVAFAEDEIKSFFSNNIVPGFSLDIIRISKSFDVGRYISEVRKLTKLLDQKEIKSKEQNKSKGHAKEIGKLNQKITNINNFFTKKKPFLTNFQILMKNDICFITFNTKQEAKVIKRKFEASPTQRALIQICQRFSKEFADYFFHGKFIKVEKAPEPTEIIWENLSRPKVSLWFHLVYAVLCTAIFSITSFSIWWVCSSDLPYCGWIVGIIIAVTNELFCLLVFGLSAWEKFKTITEKRIFISYKLSFLQITNMILPVYILNVVFLSFDTSVLSSHFLFIGVCCFALPLFIRLLHPRLLLKYFRRLRAQLQGPKCTLTQDQANQLFEYPELNICALYSNLLKTLMFACFTFSMSPGVAFVALVSLILMYWIDKYNLLRRSLIPSYMRSELSEAIFECLEFALLLLAFGNLTFSLTIDMMVSKTKDTTLMFAVSIFEITLMFTYMFLPHKKINRSLYPVKREPAWSANLFHQQVAEYFPHDYYLCNPITRLGLPSQEMKEKYKDILQKYNCVQMLADCLEVLPLFEYAYKYPTPFDIWAQNLEGLKNPYYIYPQNYGYGLVRMNGLNKVKKPDNKASLLEEGSSSKYKKGWNNKYDKGISKFGGKDNDGASSSGQQSRDRNDTRDLAKLVGEMSSISRDIEMELPKPFTFNPLHESEEHKHQDVLRKREQSYAQDTLVFNSVKSESNMLAENLLDGSRNSIAGISPVIDSYLTKYN